MIVLKWICFIFVCLDSIAYVCDMVEVSKGDLAKVIGLILGIFARAFVLYGTATCWLLT